MSKRPNLAAVAAAAGSTRKAPPPEAPAVAAPKPEARSEPRQRGRRVAGMKQIAAHFPAEVAWQLRELAVERRSTVQALVGEALNDLFQKHGKPEIVPPELPAQR